MRLTDGSAAHASIAAPSTDASSMESARIAALERLMLLDSAPEEAYDDLVALASEICGTPIALVSLIDGKRLWFKARVGLEACETTRDVAFCEYAIATPDQLFVVSDASRDPRFANHPMVTGDAAIRFYAGAPIVTDDGHALGTVCVIDTQPRTLTPSQERCLRALARQASTLVDLRRHSSTVARIALAQAGMTAEARLKQEKGAELLDLVLQGRDLGLWDLDVAAGRWTASAHERALLGYADHPEEAAALDWRTLIHPDDRAIAVSSMGPHLRGEAPYYECTLRMRHREGHWLWMLSRAVVVERDAANGPSRIVGTHMDVTEQRRMEAERQQTSERLELALVGSDIGIWDADLSTGRVIYNEHWATMLGYTLSELDKKPDLWRAAIHPDDSEAFTTRLYAHMRGELPIVEAEGRMRHKDGPWVWMLVRAKVFERDQAGRALRVVGMNLNITARKRSELALADEVSRRRALLDHASEFVFVLQQGLRLNEVNRCFAEALGYGIDEVMQLRPWQWDAIADDPQKFRARWTAFPWPTWTAEMTWRRKDGSALDVAVSCTTLTSMGKDEYLFVARDITDSKRDRVALERARHLLEETGRLARVGGWEVDLLTETVTWSREVFRIHELETDYVPTMASAIGFYALEARALITTAVEAAITDGVAYDLQLQLVTARERPIWVRAIGRAEFDDGRAVRLVGTFQDITDRKAAEDAIASSERRLRMITDHMPALIMYIDREQRYCFINDHVQRMLGMLPADVLGQTMRNVCGEEFYARLAPHVERALHGEAVEFEDVGVGQDASLSYQCSFVPDVDASGTVAGFYALIFDITELKQTQQKLQRLVRADTLTGLPNRRHFEERAGETLARVRRTGGIAALLYLDVDHFKSINDSLGHASGDDLLQKFAARVSDALRETDFVARYAGDEFVALVEGVHDAAEAGMIAGKIASAVRRPFSLQSVCLFVTTSIGVAILDGAQPLKTVLANADAALYDAKAAGRNTYSVARTGTALTTA